MLYKLVTLALVCTVQGQLGPVYIDEDANSHGEACLRVGAGEPMPAADSAIMNIDADLNAPGEMCVRLADEPENDDGDQALVRKMQGNGGSSNPACLDAFPCTLAATRVEPSCVFALSLACTDAPDGSRR